jgi:dipeptidase
MYVKDAGLVRSWSQDLNSCSCTTATKSPQVELFRLGIWNEEPGLVEQFEIIHTFSDRAAKVNGYITRRIFIVPHTVSPVNNN